MMPQRKQDEEERERGNIYRYGGVEALAACVLCVYRNGDNRVLSIVACSPGEHFH
jgi:hypothetical protein